MNEPPPHRPMFPESRLMLGMLSPLLGIFFAFCIYFTSVWQPATIGDRIGKFAVQDILFTFITLCGVGLIASVVGPHRIRPLILRIGGKAARAGVAFMLGSIVYVLYCWLAS
jgi:hypothetical protein